MTLPWIVSEMRLRTLLATSFGLLAFGMTAAAAITISQIVNVRVGDRVGRDMAQLAGQVRNVIEANLDERLADMEVLAAVARTTAHSADARRRWVDAMRQVYPVYAWIGFAGRDGIVEASTDGILGGADVSARPWFAAGMSGPFLGEMHEALLLESQLPPDPSGQPLRFIDVAAPVQDPGGAVVGVVAGPLDWRWVQEVTREAVASLRTRDPATQVVVLARDGRILVAPPALQGAVLPSGILASLADDIGREGRYAIEPWPDGRSVLIGTSRTAGRAGRTNPGWTVLMVQPTAVALAASRRLISEIMAGGALFVVVAAIVGWWLAGRIARPLLDLSEAARELDGHAGHLPPAAGFREVKQLTQSINGLMLGLAQRDSALAAANRGLESRVAARTAELAQSNAFIGSILDTTPDGVLVVGLDGRIEFANEGGPALFGIPDRDGVLGHPLTGLWTPDERAKVREALDHAACGDAESLVLRLPSLAERERWCHLSLTPIVGERGAPERVLALARDVSALKAGEEALRSARDLAEQERSRAERLSHAKADFLANMSHELRTPLAGMLGVHELLRDDPALGERQRRLFALAHEAGRSLLVIVNDVLDFSKIDAGQLRIERVPFGLRHLVERTCRIAREGVGPRPIEVGAQIPADLPDRLVGDPTRIGQVLLNLATNAVKFTESGRVEIGVSGPAGRLRFAIADTGIGIAPETVPALFDRFSQADSSTTRRFGGTGLGLAICKRLVELMGGTIGVDSEPGRGSVFWFELALEAAPREAATPASPARDASEIVSRSLLLVEDHELNREILGSVLGRQGHRVALAASGDEAVAAVRASRFDVVLMDIQMPGKDGLAATAEIRAFEAGAGRPRTPIVALTANATAEEAARCRAAGMDAHIGKPVDWPMLQAAIDRLCAAEPDRTPRGAEKPAAAAVMDESVIRTLAGYIGEERIGGLLRAFRSETGRRLALLAREETTLADLATHAHVLVSMSGQLGFAELSAFCAWLEARDEDADLGHIAELRRVADRALEAAAAYGSAAA